MANTNDEHTKERIKSNKRNNETEVEAIFVRSKLNLYKVYAQYRNGALHI